MKHYFSWVGTLFLALALTSCGTHRNPYVNEDLAKETWKASVDTTPSRWLHGTDEWFMNGDPYMVQRISEDSPASAAISTMKVEIPDGCMNLRVDGDFQVQLFGAYDHNSVFIFGPNDAIRGVDVRVVGNTIYLVQTKEAPKSICDVIIRIGLQDLRLLKQKGAGRIEGRSVRSSNMVIDSCGKGNIYLAGNMNVTKVNSEGEGSITAIGVNAPDTIVNMCGKGSVNLSGNIGISSINHKGSGEMDVIGLNSNGLNIITSGKGKIGLKGTANIKQIDARNRTRVLMYNVSSDTLNAYVKDTACIGLAGYANNLYVDARQSSCFEGKDLMTQDAYVSARGSSHINARASNKMFASATDNASVYFFGPPNFMSRFISGNGVVIPIYSPAPIYKDAPIVRKALAYKDEVPPPRLSVKVYKYNSSKKYR